MLKYTWENLKNSVRSRYFLMGILLMTGLFFCSKGQGLLCIQVQETPLIIQEILSYSVSKYEQNIMEYSAASMFAHGMSGFMYLVMPMTGIGYLLRFCDERYGGYDRMILARIGKRNYFAGTLFTSALLAIITVLVSGTVILVILYTLLPSGVGIYGVPGIWDCVRKLGFACVLAVIGSWLGFFTAVITESRFLAIVMPVLVYEIWTEMCEGVTFGNDWYYLNLKTLFDPIQKGTPLPMYMAFVVIGLLGFGVGFYLVAIKKLEKGR